MALELGVCVASDISDIEYAVLAEELGFRDLWFADSQMIWSDCYATMALAASRTSRIRIGTGVAVAGTRSSAVTAAAHGTIQKVAPGRVFCGIGTGNTAMRVAGHRPMPIAEFETYIGHFVRCYMATKLTSSGEDEPALFDISFRTKDLSASNQRSPCTFLASGRGPWRLLPNMVTDS